MIGDTAREPEAVFERFVRGIALDRTGTLRCLKDLSVADFHAASREYVHAVRALGDDRLLELAEHARPTPALNAAGCFAASWGCEGSCSECVATWDDAMALSSRECARGQRVSAVRCGRYRKLLVSNGAEAGTLYVFANESLRFLGARTYGPGGGSCRGEPPTDVPAQCSEMVACKEDSAFAAPEAFAPRSQGGR